MVLGALLSLMRTMPMRTPPLRLGLMREVALMTFRLSWKPKDQEKGKPGPWW